jgi:hypothetical protein
LIQNDNSGKVSKPSVSDDPNDPETTPRQPWRMIFTAGQFYEIEDEEARWQAIAEANQLAAMHKADFDPALYNIWKQQNKSDGAEHFGNSEPRWLDIDTGKILAMIY